jgi:hypothetical protein
MKRDVTRRRASIWENAILLLFGVFVFIAAGSADSRGIKQKWLTALLVTLIPFCFVFFFRRKSLRWAFLVSLGICLVVHLVAIWAFFQFVLARFESSSILFWLPVMLVEVFILLIVVKRIEEKISGKHETIRLTF